MSSRKRRKGPLFVYYLRYRQMRVGKPREPVMVLELREDAKAGDTLILTRRDLNFVTDSITVDRLRNAR